VLKISCEYPDQRSTCHRNGNTSYPRKVHEPTAVIINWLELKENCGLPWFQKPEAPPKVKTYIGRNPVQLLKEWEKEYCLS
jgi:hypothetical protein